jgi:hypothetical protein
MEIVVFFVGDSNIGLKRFIKRRLEFFGLRRSADRNCVTAFRPIA